MIPDIFIKELPAGSLRASGQVAHELVWYIRQGKQCVRRYIIPPYTCTPEQMNNRNKFRAGMKAWAELPEAEKRQWHLRGRKWKKPVPGVNAFLRAWLKDLI